MEERIISVQLIHDGKTEELDQRMHYNPMDNGSVLHVATFPANSEKNIQRLILKVHIAFIDYFEMAI